MEALAPYLVIWLVCGFVTAAVWSSKGGSSGSGFVMGVLFGPLAVLIAFFASPSGAGGAASIPKRSCPHCREPMAVDARTCAQCRGESDPIPVTAGAPAAKIRGEVVYAELARHGPQSIEQLARGTATQTALIRGTVRALLRANAITANPDGTYTAT